MVVGEGNVKRRLCGLLLVTPIYYAAKPFASELLAIINASSIFTYLA